MKMMKKTHGFTLMEMMMIVAIISISAAVSGFTFGRMLPDMRVKAAANEIKSDLNLARLKAVRENNDVSIDFSRDDGYEIYVTNPDDSTTLLKTVTYPDGVLATAMAFGGDAVVSFDGRGLPKETGHVYLVNDKGTFSGVDLSLFGKITILHKPE